MTSTSPPLPYLEITQESGRCFFSEPRPGPLVMLNLLRFRAIPIIPRGPRSRPQNRSPGPKRTSGTSPRRGPTSSRQAARSWSWQREASISLAPQESGGTWCCWCDIRVPRAFGPLQPTKPTSRAWAPTGRTRGFPPAAPHRAARLSRGDSRRGPQAFLPRMAITCATS